MLQLNAKQEKEQEVGSENVGNKARKPLQDAGKHRALLIPVQFQPLK